MASTENPRQSQVSNNFLDLMFAGPMRVLVSIVIPVITFLVMWRAFIFMRDSDAPKLAIAAVALVVGVGGVWMMFFIMDDLVSRLPENFRDMLRPFVFVGPAMAILFAYLIYPTLNTLWLSFFGASLRNPEFVGLDNYVFAFTDPQMLIAFRNNLMWIVLVTFFSVSLGLVIAVLVDRIKWEPIAKSLIFLPMAISFVGASVIWRFVYFFQPTGRAQIGLLNAVVTALGGEPVAWLIQRPWNNLFLIVIMIWLQTGFAMVIISAAVKGVPEELLEAARIDGATEVQIFFRVIIPYIQGTIVTVSTTIIILVLKVFDIVFVMTSGQHGTEVIANRMYNEMFKFRNFGRGSALAVILLIAVIPVMISNLRSMRQQEMIR